MNFSKGVFISAIGAGVLAITAYALSYSSSRSFSTAKKTDQDAVLQRISGGAKFPHGVRSLAGRSLMTIADLSAEELLALLELSANLKAFYKNGQVSAPLAGKSLGMIFQKRSTRTRVSSETGMSLLGGHALFLGPSDIQLGVNECMLDTAKVLSGFNSVILARVFAHSDVQELAENADVPVINALSDLYHPLQTLADLLTLQEHFGKDLEGLTVTWVGDGNNVLHDLMIGAAKLGMNVNVACPEGYRPDPEITQLTKQIIKENGKKFMMTADPIEAVKGSNVVVTDTWVSMGQEEEAAIRLKAFEGYEVNNEMMSHAADNAVFLHCLPRHKEEVSDEVFYSERSLVFPEAENRMWTVMSVILSMLGK
mmetsp:Transcript_15593/g.20567  ORF Transcript_15593/g.20567 Transcript_15593/m.20567 type:complete len:368 (-) Transcript_15593:311-1414(-)